MSYRFLIFFLLLHCGAYSQISDILSVRKKNGISVKSFTTGSRILLQTVNGIYIEGPVKAIQNDSVFITIYDIRSYPTPQGGRMIDTVSSYVSGMHYKEIQRIQVYKRYRPIRGKIGKILKFGGAGYFALSLLNGFYTNGELNKDGNMKYVLIPVAAIGTGVLIDKLFPVSNFSGKKHTIIYVKLQR
jgi:hypothetical protein